MSTLCGRTRASLRGWSDMTNNMIFGVPRTMRKVEFPSGKDEYSGDDGFVTTDPNEAAGEVHRGWRQKPPTVLRSA